MHEPDKNPVVLTSAANDMEAAMIVSTLAAHGLDATTTGDFTAGFRAEAPGDVEVLVRQSDLQEARQVLGEIANQQATEAQEAATKEEPMSDPPAMLQQSTLIFLLLGAGVLLCVYSWLIG